MKLDIKELIAKIVGQTEFKTLLWTNTQGAQTSYSFSADFTQYDELEVTFERSGCLYCFRRSVTNGTASFIFPYGNYLVVRASTISSNNTFSFGNGGFYNGYNTGSVSYAQSYAVPYKVYGIRKVGGGSI